MRLFELLSTVVFAALTPDMAAESRLRQSLQQTREMAAAAGTRAVLCPSRDGQACASAPDWSEGWIAFLDADGNGEHAPGETLLLSQAALPGEVRLRSTLGRTRLVFADGLSSTAGFTLCDARGAAHARALWLARDGQLRPATPARASIAATCTQPSETR